MKHHHSGDSGVGDSGAGDLSAPDHAAAVPVTVAGSRMEAELIVGMLRSNGLHAAVPYDPTFERNDMRPRGVPVLVAPADVDAARQLLDDTAE
jgi:hypothetical protein